MDYKRFIIIGGGIAGVTAAREIRSCLPDSQITLISREKSLPYIRPLLSKAAFSSCDEKELWMHGPGWYADHRIILKTAVAATGIDTREHQVELSDGTILPYDRLVYALGARPFIPRIAGRDKKNVIALRSIADFKVLQKALLLSAKVLVAGGGAVGLETAWELGRCGLEVTVVENEQTLLGRFIDRETSVWLAGQAKARGIAVRTGTAIAEIKGGSRCEEVLLADGSRLPCDLLVLSCGIRPDTSLAVKSGIACDRGVLVSAAMRTDQADVFACGDCIQLRDGRANPGLWTYGIGTGKSAGRGAAGFMTDLPVMAVPELLLNAFETSLFSIGDVHTYDSCENGAADGCGQAFFKVNPEGGKEATAKYFYREGQLTGAILAGNLAAIGKIKEEMNTGN